jgi:hypothetical protein
MAALKLASVAEYFSRRIALAVSLVAVLFIALAGVGYLWIQSDALATLTAATGPLHRDTTAELEQWRPADVGDDFGAGDGARTSQAAEAQFRLQGGARLKLKPASVVRFARRGPKGALGLQVQVGEASLETTTAALTISSEFGELVIDAGSTLSLTRSGARLELVVELGRVQVAGRAWAAGESVTLEFGGIVFDPAPASSPQPASTPPAISATQPAPATPALVLGDGVASADLSVKAGSSFVVHDPTPPVSVGFVTSSVCAGPARLSTPTQQTEALGQANLRLERGQHAYEVRCLDQPNVIAAKGMVRVLQDAGTLSLPLFAPTATVATDGRRYTVMYQHRLPNVTVSWPTAPAAEGYTLLVDGRRIEARVASYTLSSLSRGTHRVLFSASTTPPRQSRETTIEVAYDAQAPAARVSEPAVGFDAAESVTIGGQALPGWSVSVGEQALQLDAQHKFRAELDGRGAIPITFSHPSHGVHYYLRRPKASP